CARPWGYGSGYFDYW
nr:immunoglobulin heavy chain junction region [Macaca mulatta]